MSILTSERGLVSGLVLTFLTVSFLVSGIIAVLAHNAIVAGVLFLIGVTLFPIGSKLVSKFAS